MNEIYFGLINYEAHDFVINAIQKRFEQPYDQTYVTLQITAKSRKNQKWRFFKERKLVTEFYDTDVVPERLKLHLKDFTEICSGASDLGLQSVLSH